jgi:glycosyltransferase involved in cell wall biosynthesis
VRIAGQTFCLSPKRGQPECLSYENVNKPLLSVVIPTWNRAHVVCEAVESALQQRQRAVEVIVVDDASTDNTADLVKTNFGKWIHLLKLAVRRGPGAARNAGALLACGEFVAFLDSDDVWLPGKLDAELRVFAEFPHANAVVSDSQNFFEGQPDGETRFAQNGLLNATKGRTLFVEDCAWLWTNSMNTVHTCGITVRRKVLADPGRRLFAEDLACCEDWEFQLRLYQLGQVVVLPEVYSWVRRFNDGSRLGRGVPGQPPTRAQQIILLQARLTVIERAKPWLSGLRADLAAEFERFRLETETELNRLTTKVKTA